MYPNLRDNKFLKGEFVLTWDHAAATADATDKIYKLGRAFRIDRVKYLNVTGLVQDGTNFFNVRVQIAGSDAANWSSETGQEGTIPVNDWVDMSDGLDADRVGEADDEITLFMDEDGDTTLPAGRVQIEGRYL